MGSLTWMEQRCQAQNLLPFLCQGISIISSTYISPPKAKLERFFETNHCSHMIKKEL